MCVLIAYTYFTICFDYAIKQPTYVVYKQKVLGGCDKVSVAFFKFEQNPPNSYKHDDYKAITDIYDRGHLVPNADYGCSTYITGNIVPHTIRFNRGKWSILEKHIRDNYNNMTILKGCKYEGRIYKSFSIPEGCYWIVLDNNNNLIDNGYIDQFTYVTSKILPNWYYDYLNTHSNSSSTHSNNSSSTHSNNSSTHSSSSSSSTHSNSSSTHSNSTHNNDENIDTTHSTHDKYNAYDEYINKSNGDQSGIYIYLSMGTFVSLIAMTILVILIVVTIIVAVKYKKRRRIILR